MATPTWPALLTALMGGAELSADDTAWAMDEVMTGNATPAQLAAFAVLLRAKGETPQELSGLVRTMIEHAAPLTIEGRAVDVVGTGGDRAHTVNISTMAALVVAGAGVRVVKHGNRAASSRCGSADVLEALGVAIDLEPEGVVGCIEEAGIGFCFAPLYHPAMSHAVPVRRELGVPTVFNFLGPLTNPAGVRRQTIGVSDAAMAPKIAEALERLGAEHALVFRGQDGLDELTTTGPSDLWEVTRSVRQSVFDPGGAGIARAIASDLAGADPEENAKVCERVLAGEPGPP